MSPNNQPVPLDYLDQIAPVQQKQHIFGFNLKTVLLIGSALVILVIILSAAVSSVSNSRNELWQHLYARLNSLSTIVDDGTSKLKDGQLRTANSDLRLYVTNTSRDLDARLTALDINKKKIPEKITTSESSDKILEELEDARLNAKYDTAYSRETSYVLATMLSLLKQLSVSDKSTKNREFAQTAYTNLEPIYKTISEYSAENE